MKAGLIAVTISVFLSLAIYSFAEELRHGGVLGALDDVRESMGKADTPAPSKNPPEEKPNKDKAPAPTEEKWSDFVRDARNSMERKSEPPAQKKEDLKSTAPAEKPIEPVIDAKYKEEADREIGEAISSAKEPVEGMGREEGPHGELLKAGKYGSKAVGVLAGHEARTSELLDNKIAADSARSLKTAAGVVKKGFEAGQVVAHIKENKPYKAAGGAAEMIADVAAGPHVRILVKPAAAAVEATAVGVENVNKTLDKPTEENIKKAVKYVETLPDQIAKNTGLDPDKARGLRDRVYDKIYRIAPSLLPEQEKTKRDVEALSKANFEALESAFEPAPPEK